MVTRIVQDEIALELKVCKRALDEYGVSNIKLNTSSSTGYPDRLFFIPGGRPLMIEFKAPDEEPKPKQLFIHSELWKLGYCVQVHDNEDEAMEAIATALKRGLSAKRGRHER